jgi:hypothetical protein
VRGDEAADAEVHRVAERQHAALAEQHVEGQREHDGDAHLVHHRHRGARAHEPRQHDQHPAAASQTP